MSKRAPCRPPYDHVEGSGWAKYKRASEAAKIFVGGGTMSLTCDFSLADKEDEEGILVEVSGRLRFVSVTPSSASV